MKKLINLGTSVDVGDGDYLRKGGEKINSNFNDIYYNLGDGNELHSAGAWKIINKESVGSDIYEAKFGESLIVDTTNSGMKIHLPKGKVPDNVGMIVKLRDAFVSWMDIPVEVRPARGDTIKGKSGYTTLHRSLSDIELIYTSKSRWEYVETTQLDKHRSTDLRSVVTVDYIAYEGQTDFPNPFGVDKYNPQGLEVYRRGNRLYYGEKFSENSEYGSIGDSGELVELNGETIKLREPCNEGDTIAFTSYIDGIETFRTSYTKRTYRIRNEDNVFGVESDNDILINQDEFDNDGYILLSNDMLGIETYDNLNPYALDIYLNGVLLNKMGDVGSGYHCVGADKEYTDPLLCEINGGEWKPKDREADYNFVYEGSSVVGFEFNFEFEDDDILTIVWFNNIIGTTLSLDDIENNLTSSFISSTDEFHISRQVYVDDVENIEGLPTQKDVVYDNTDFLYKPNSVMDILELVYPIGHIYTNLYNNESPELTLGFGKWRRLSGYVIAGFNDDQNDDLFGQNKNFLDSEGNPTKTPGNTIGSLENKLTLENIPNMKISEKVLVETKDGDINIGACMVDPDEEIPVGYSFRSTDEVTVGNDSPEAITINNIQPTMVVSMWVRVA